jgi:hypothetical protein
MYVDDSLYIVLSQIDYVRIINDNLSVAVTTEETLYYYVLNILYYII